MPMRAAYGLAHQRAAGGAQAAYAGGPVRQVLAFQEPTFRRAGRTALEAIDLPRRARALVFAVAPLQESRQVASVHKVFARAGQAHKALIAYPAKDGFGRYAKQIGDLIGRVRISPPDALCGIARPLSHRARPWPLSKPLCPRRARRSSWGPA